MAGFRSFICETNRQCECAVPLLVSGDEREIDLDWCINTCNSTACEGYRNDATSRMVTFSHFLFITSAITGLVLAALLTLALFLLHRIISEPIASSSKESNIPLWLTFPTILSFLGGIYFLTQSELSSNEQVSMQVNKQVLNNHWIGVCYIITGCAFLASALLGWVIAATTVLDSRDKTRKKIAVYLFIGMMVLTIFADATILSYSLYTSIYANIDLSDRERGITACFFDVVGSCSNCNITQSNETIEDIKICPEWNHGDVLKLIRTQMKQSAALAVIFIMYALTALRFGFTLKALVSRYEVAYV